MSHEIITPYHLRPAKRLAKLQQLAGLDDADAARWCRISPETYRRLKRDRPPTDSTIFLMEIAYGTLPWTGWEKYQIQHGKLFHMSDPDSAITLEELGLLLTTINEWRKLFHFKNGRLHRRDINGPGITLWEVAGLIAPLEETHYFYAAIADKVDI